MFIFFGLKNSSDIIGDYTIFHRGVAVTGTLQNHATTESFCYHVLEDKATKSNNKYVYSLYSEVNKFGNSKYGVYIPLSDTLTLAANNREMEIEFPVNIPITSVLCFEGFGEYPNNILGELLIRLKINPNAFVYCMVDPYESLQKTFLRGWVIIYWTIIRKSRHSTTND